MRDHFGRIVGTTPRAYRLAFRGRTVTKMRRGGVARSQSVR
jgi:hypothetical protein